jgi:hypothetical protein
MRTTLEIPDPLYRELKRRAAHEGCSIKQLILRVIEGELHVARKPRRKRVALPLIASKRPGTLEIDNLRISELVPFP